MKIASIVLPVPEPGVTSKKTIAIREGHKAIKEALTANYKGYTYCRAQGVWVDPATNSPLAEEVIRYDFAAEDRRVVEDDVRALAYSIKTITDEQSIMVVHTNGKVEFI